MKSPISTPFFSFAFNLRLAGRRALFIFAALLLIGIQTIIFSGKASAAAPYLASDLLGQTSYDGSTIDFNANSWDAGSFPGPDLDGTMLGGYADTVIDPTSRRLFAADGFNNRILIYELDGSYELIDKTPDYVLGQPDFATNTSQCTQNGLYRPQGIEFDSTTNLLYVSDRLNNRVVVYDVASITNYENAINVLGQANFTTCTNDTNASGFWYPLELSLDETNQRLFVSDEENRRVLVFDTNTITDNESAVNVLGQANFTSRAFETDAKGFFRGPWGIEYDDTTELLYVADRYADRVLIFDVSTIVDNEDAINILGQSNFTTNTNDTNSSGFYEPMSMALDQPNGRLFVQSSRNSRILVFDINSVTDNEAAINVIGQPDFTTSSLRGLQNGFDAGTGLYYSPLNEKLYVSDWAGGRLLLFDVNSITNFENAVDVLGQDNFVDGGANKDPAPNARGFGSVQGVTIDEVNHRLFVTDAGHYRILVFNLDENNNLEDRIADAVIGQKTTYLDDYLAPISASTFGGSYIGGSAYDPVYDRLFVHDSDNCRVLVFDVSTITNGEDATHVIGQPDFVTTDCDVTQNRMDFSDSGDLSFDAENQRLFVEDLYYNGRVLVYDVAPGTIANGMNASYVIGKPDFVTGGGTDGQNGLCWDEGGVYYSPMREWLIVGDGCNYRVLIFDISSGITNGMNASYVLGQPDFNTYNRYNGTFPVEQAGMYYPEAVSMDEENGILYVNEQNYRIMVFDVNEVTNFEPAIAVLGAPDFTTRASGVSQSEIDYNSEYANSAFDQVNKRLYYPDQGNYRVLIFDMIKIDTPSLPISEPDEAFSQNVAVSNDQGTVSYTVTSGSLPAGLSLDTGSGAITGTPSVQGTFDFTVTATDDNGTAGYFFDKQDYSLKITDDYDDDGNKNVDERDTPFGNDVNNDATPDWQQSTVSIAKNNAVSGTYIASSVSNCPAGFSAFTSDAEEDLSAQDDDYSYPLGMQTFTAECGTNGITADFTIYFDKEYDTSNWMYRKYTAALGYFDFSDQVTYGTERVNGKTVTTASFSVTDGSAFDADGVVNGTIIDPVGPAVLGALAETGGSYLDDAILSASLILAVFIVAHITRDRVYRLRRN